MADRSPAPISAPSLQHREKPRGLIRTIRAARAGSRSYWRLFTPKLVTALREGYSAGIFRADALAGLTVAIVALPLAMALAIASGATPEKGLITAVVAGFLASALGGSRFSISGPTGAFVVVIFTVIAEHGYDGLLLATFMAGLMLIVAGFLKLGTYIKYIPDPVVTGFTSGIAVIIASSQVKDFFGLQLADVPAEFFAKWQALIGAAGTISIATTAIAVAGVVGILLLRRHAPKLPNMLMVVVGASVATAAFGLPVETIGSKFGTISGSFPAPALPQITLDRLVELLPSALTIAFLAGLESLLCAMVADSMTGRRHRSNSELVAQGVANTASALVGGLPATGAIARTATNIRSGARTPVSGIMHAVFVLAFLLVAAPLAAFVPLAALAAVLMIVAYNMSEIERFRSLLSAPWGDRLVLIATFLLTVMVDLTVAIQVGIVLAAILFMHRMSEVVAISTGAKLIEDDQDDALRPSSDRIVEAVALPDGVAVVQLRGPLFFGVASRITDALDRIGQHPRVYVVRMRQVPLMDATGAAKLGDFLKRCHKNGQAVIIAGLQPQPAEILAQMRLLDGVTGLRQTRTLARAIEIAGTLSAEMAGSTKP